MKNVLFLSSWYPSRVHTTLGNFVRYHALAASKYNSINVLYIVADDNVKDYGYCSGDKFAMYLMDKGMVDTRAKDISKAMADLYIAVCRCDNSQRRRLISDNLWILQTAQKYAEVVGNCETLTD